MRKMNSHARTRDRVARQRVIHDRCSTQAGGYVIDHIAPLACGMLG
jgi:hypothetical protein